MADPFVFKKVLYLVEATGLRAGGLDELLRLVTLADANSIGFHMHREFLQYKFAHAEYPNDFAYWVVRVLGDEILGERLANLRVLKHASLSDVQREIGRLIADHVSRYPNAAAQRAPRGRDFNLCNVRKFVMETGRTARDLMEFAGAIAEIEASSLYYHLFETRFMDGQVVRPNDFAAWVELSLGRHDLAARLTAFDPYMYSLEQTRRVLLRVLTEEAGPR